MSAANPFEALADRQIAAPVKRRMAASAAKKSARQIAQQDEDALLAKWYRAWKREQREALLSGPYSAEVKGLVAFLRAMDLDAAPDLLDLIESADWVKQLTRDERHVLYGIIARAVARCREKAGLEPYDDGVIGEPPKAMHLIRDMLEIR